MACWSSQGTPAPFRKRCADSTAFLMKVSQVQGKPNAILNWCSFITFLFIEESPTPSWASKTPLWTSSGAAEKRKSRELAGTCWRRPDTVWSWIGLVSFGITVHGRVDTSAVKKTATDEKSATIGIPWSKITTNRWHDWLPFGISNSGCFLGKPSQWTTWRIWSPDTNVNPKPVSFPPFHNFWTSWTTPTWNTPFYSLSQNGCGLSNLILEVPLPRYYHNLHMVKKFNSTTRFIFSFPRRWRWDVTAISHRMHDEVWVHQNRKVQVPMVVRHKRMQLKVYAVNSVRSKLRRINEKTDSCRLKLKEFGMLSTRQRTKGLPVDICMGGGWDCKYLSWKKGATHPPTAFDLVKFTRLF